MFASYTTDIRTLSCFIYSFGWKGGAISSHLIVFVHSSIYELIFYYYFFIGFLYVKSRQHCTVEMPEITPVSCVSVSGEMYELHADGHSDGETAWRIQRPGALFLLGRTQILHPLATV